ncbi:MAG: dienelactone hydrolase family protein [Akkermansiaceae bacterium]|nr:dienelactone hydrolase family protein [Akkermansiaceae bacterium]
MKSLLAGIFLTATSLASHAAEQLYLRQSIPDSVPLPTTVNRTYRLLVPAGAAEKPDQKFPLVVYLHGGGSRGEDGLKPVNEPLPKLLATEDMRGSFPCFVLVPQCREGLYEDGRPYNWTKWENQTAAPALWLKSDDEASDQLRAAMAALKDVLDRQPVDPARVYLSGVSMGGSGSWSWAARQPERFAALLTVCGLSEVSRAEPISKVPVWTFHGAKDEVVPVQRTRDLVKALEGFGGKVKYTEYPEGGHGVAGQAFTEDDHAAIRWLFEQRR